MGPDLREPGALGAPLQDPHFQIYVREQAKSKLGKYGRAIRSLRIGIRGMTTAGGDPWVACRITVGLAHGDPVVFERPAAMAWEAFDHTLGVAVRGIRQALQKRRHRLG